MHEGFHNQEVNREELVSVIREKGVESAEAVEIWTRWYDNRSAMAETGGTQARIDFIFEQAAVLKEAGCSAQAREALEDALFAAESEGNYELSERLTKEIESLA